MGDYEPDEDSKKSLVRASSSAASSTGHPLTKRNFNVGEAQTLLELAAEFGPYKVTVKTHVIGRQTIVDLRTTTPELAKFIDFLLTQLRGRQLHLIKNNPDLSTK